MRQRIIKQLHKRMSYLKRIEPDELGECLSCSSEERCSAHIDMHEIKELLEMLEGIDQIGHHVDDKGFAPRHIRAISRIVGMFNYSKESERAIFEFADGLKERFAK